MELFGTQVPMIAIQIGGFIGALAAISVVAFVYGYITRDRA